MSIAPVHTVALTPDQLQALTYLKRNGPQPRFALARAGVDSSVIRSLCQRGFVDYDNRTHDYACNAAGRKLAR